LVEVIKKFTNYLIKVMIKLSRQWIVESTQTECNKHVLLFAACIIPRRRNETVGIRAEIVDRLGDGRVQDVSPGPSGAIIAYLSELLVPV